MWPATDSNSAAIFARAQQVLPDGISRLLTWLDPYPIYAKRGKRGYIEDVDGHLRLDLMNNFASLIHGHAHPKVVDAVKTTLEKGSCFALPTENEIQLAELLCQRIKSVEKVRFCNSGTEAIMIAIKAARARTNRPRIAKIEGAYHGMYDHAEVSLASTPENWGNTPTPIPHAFGTPKSILEDTIVLPMNSLEESERLLRAQSDSIAAIVIDPVPTNLGMIEMEPSYLSMIQDLAQDIGALIIVDEVIAFRLAYNGAQSRYAIKADYTTLAKIIGGGYPVGAVCGTEDAMTVFSQKNGSPLNPSSGTFTGNPVSMAAGLATMQIMTPSAYNFLEDLGEYCRRELEIAFKEGGYSGQITGVGSMFQLHFHTRPLIDYRSAYKTPEEEKISKFVHREMLDYGFILSPRCSGFLSTVNTKEELKSMAKALAKTLKAIK